MEVVHETSLYVNTATSPDQEYEEIRLDERKPDLKEPNEFEQGSQIELTSRNRNKSNAYCTDGSTRKEKITTPGGTATAYTAHFAPKRLVLIAVATSFVSFLAIVISLLAIIIVITASPKTAQHTPGFTIAICSTWFWARTNKTPYSGKGSMEDRAGKFLYMGSAELRRKENQRRENVQQKLLSDKVIHMVSKSNASNATANEVCFPEKNTDDKERSNGRKLDRVVHRLIKLVIVLTFISIAALVLSLLLFTGVLGSKTNATSKEPNKEGQQRVQDVKADMADLDKSHREIKVQFEKNLEELKTRLVRLESEHEKINVLCKSSQQKVNIIERELLLHGMNFSTSGTNFFEMDLTKLWTEVNITREKLESKTGELKETAEKSQAHFTATSQRLAKLSSKLNVTIQRLRNADWTFSSALTSVNMTLTSQIDKVTKMSGHIGPPGYNGSRGPTGSPGIQGPPGAGGSGGFKQCLYKVEGSTSVSSGSAVKADKTVIEASGKRIVGATCSTDDAKIFRLSSSIVSTGASRGRRVYKCDCAGRADLMRNPTGKMKCFLHYWECPLVT